METIAIYTVIILGALTAMYALFDLMKKALAYNKAINEGEV